MKLSLPAELAGFVSAKVASGEFRSVDEVVIAALRRFQDADSSRLAGVRAAITVAYEQLARGEYVELADEVARRRYFDGVKRSRTE